MKTKRNVTIAVRLWPHGWAFSRHPSLAGQKSLVGPWTVDVMPDHARAAAGRRANEVSE